MATQYQVICQEVTEFVKRGEYERAASLLEKYKGVREKFIARAFYILYSNKRSHYYSKEEAIEHLNFLEKAKDIWGVMEKGRCLLEGELYKKDTFGAEDLFNVALNVKSPSVDKAKYYLGLIASNGLHNPKNEDARDLEHARNMFSEVMQGESNFREPAREEYCRTIMRNGQISPQETTSLFNHLSILFNKNPDRGAPLYSEFLLEILSMLGKTVFSEERAPQGMTDKADFDARYNELRNAITVLKKILPSSK